MKKFSPQYIRGLKPNKNKPYEVHEINGLYLRVEKSGTKTFYYVFRKNRKLKRIRIGRFPAMSLADARAIHSNLMEQRELGDDPGVEVVTTVNDLADKYLDEYSKHNNTPSVYDRNKRILDSDVLPIIGSMDVDQVKRADVQACLKRVRSEGMASAHNHYLTTIRKMFNWGIEMGIAENNPAHLIKTMRTEPRDRILNDDEIKLILNLGKSDSAKMLKIKGDSAKILKMCLYTACRPGEAQAMNTKDIGPDNYWTVTQIKGGKTSKKRTYLCHSAKELISGITGPCFPGQRTNSGIARYVNRIDGLDFQPRDIRRTVATKLRMMGYSQDWVSALLGHSRGILQETYQVYAYDSEIKTMLEAWEKKVMEIDAK